MLYVILEKYVLMYFFLHGHIVTETTICVNSRAKSLDTNLMTTPHFAYHSVAWLSMVFGVLCAFVSCLPLDIVWPYSLIHNAVMALYLGARTLSKCHVIVVNVNNREGTRNRVHVMTNPHCHKIRSKIRPISVCFR